MYREIVKSMSLMKIFQIAMVITLISSCSLGKLDINQAKICAEGYLTSVKNENFEAASKFYSQMFNETESNEKRIEKMKKLTDVMGKITTYEVVDSTEKTEGDETVILLTYKVKHTKINSTEKFSIMKDEGEYKIVGHDINSE